MPALGKEKAVVQGRSVRWLPCAASRLSGADLYVWKALHRVSGGPMTRLGGWWLESGCQVSGYVTDTLSAVAKRKLVTLAKAELWGKARAVLTDDDRYSHGRALYGSVQPTQCSSQQSAAIANPSPRKPLAGRRLSEQPPMLGSRRPASHQPHP